jgi:hypothetical protein
MHALLSPIAIRVYAFLVVSGFILAYLTGDTGGCVVSNAGYNPINGYYAQSYGTYIRQNDNYGSIFSYAPSAFSIFANLRGEITTVNIVAMYV